MATQQSSRTWRILCNLGLLGAIAALATLNWQIWITPNDIRPIALEQTAPSVLGTSSEVPRSAQGPARAKIYTETLARPIFRAGRKPFFAEVTPPPPVSEEAVEAPPDAPPIEPPQGLKLVGVMRDGDGRDRALVKSAQSPSASWLQIGDDIDGWRISEIAPNTVTLSSDASTITLDLYPVAASQAETTAP